jgi:allantoicase
VEVDTSYFKGNFPDSCSLEVCRAGHEVTDVNALTSAPWKEILPNSKLKADSLHVYEKELLEGGEVTHARFHIYPDGGVARLRLLGTLSPRLA